MVQLTLFDYAALDSETRIVVQQRTGEIKGLMRKVAQDIVDIGLKLIEVKERLPHGEFLPWLNAEFKQWGERSAQNFMAVADAFKNATIADLPIAQRALYLLASPSTPDDARNEALAAAAKGEPITHARAREIIETYRSPVVEDVSSGGNEDEGEPFDEDEFPTDRLAVDALNQAADSYADGRDYEDAADARREADEIQRHLDDAEEEATASPPRFSLPTVGERDGKLWGGITLDAWEAMPASQRDALLVPPEKGPKFNDQDDNENIEWALWSWNPVTGCLHDCPYCYARDIANRFYGEKFKPMFWANRLAAPKSTPFPAAKAKEWMGHKNVFTCSMADLFGRWVPREWIEAVLDACRAAPQWNFLFLTKFPIRMAEFRFPDNAWVGTSVDCQARVKNAEKAFRKVKAGVKWLSVEPMIEPLRFADLGAFDWLVIGGASASAQTPEWHPPRPWVDALEKQARAAGVRIYEKSNLFGRIREYPGLEPVEVVAAPEALRYLPTPE